MTFDNLANPIEAVSLIPIYTYFNLLSDFLFSENYLSIDDRQSQIPVVNGLYKYFDERPNNTEELIRSLLQGSDLYGEKSDETLDEIFVNTMFDHIISSFVFSKFGNIYGFLAEVVRKTDNLKIDDLLQEFRTSLSNSIFQNENGNISSLTPLAVDRIFTDLILPLFPKSKNIDHSLLSLDYIYAQAGSILLRSGRNYATYYSSRDSEKIEINQKTLFEEYLLIGHLLEELIIDRQIENFNVTAFALPALLLYVRKEKNSLEREKMVNIISIPEHWLKAYHSFFSFLDSTYNKLDSLLKIDTMYNLHYELTQYKTFITLALYFMDEDPFCKLIPEDERLVLVSGYLKTPDQFECKVGHVLPNLNKQFMTNIINIIEAYKKFDKKLITSALTIFFQTWDPKTEVFLVTVDNTTSSPFIDRIKYTHDLIAVYFPNNGTINFFSLERSDYNVKIMKTQIHPEISQQGFATSIQEFERKKNILDQIAPIADKIVQNRNFLLKALLLTTIHETLPTDWWKEYGLSLVPLYPCLSGKIKNILYEEKDPCEIDAFTMYSLQTEKIDSISKYLIQKDTETILRVIGTSIKSLSLKYLIRKLIKDERTEIFPNFQQYHKYERYSTALKDELSLQSDKLLHLSNLWIESSPKVKKLIDILQNNILYVKITTSLEYRSILGMLKNVKKFFIDFSIMSLDKREFSYIDLYVLSNYKTGDSGYGYKYFMLYYTKAASLRTIDERGMTNKILLILNNTISPEEKEYEVINVSPMEYTNKVLYELHHKLQHSSKSLEFSGTDVAENDLIQCRRGNRTKKIPKCRRLVNREKYELIEKQILSMSMIQMPNVKKDILEKEIKNYVFPTENFSHEIFVLSWKHEENYLAPQYAKKYVIDHKEDFLKLKYSEYLEEENLNITDVTLRINSIYTQQERNIIEVKTTLQQILNAYEYGYERFSATFEDYYALRNFGTTGHRRINRDTNEAKRMQIALYNLAIRQSDDPVENFDLVLTTLEPMRKKSVKKLFFDQVEYTLQKFTITDKNLLNQFAYDKKDFEYVLLNMTFSKTYLRAKIQQKMCFVHPMTILLPGSKFIIGEINYTNLTGVGYVLKIDLKYFHETNEKYLWYQKIMKTVMQIM
ncbi:uncharacterized protein LOC122500191 [Leptopilina heterotoma]|uniref:uncharacterized protein LOC122500191 n=1 Tax=Leptopilina heterotoma TaxID=63436 RepID=UPI001CAA1DE7|nr:uncharacterized protein LOC122500191 [Leptopilina heterotoma]